MKASAWLFATALLWSTAAQGQNLPMRPYLSVEAVEAGVGACFAYAHKHGLRIALAVNDSGGNLVYFKRMDDVFVRQGLFAQLKAESAATTPVSTKRLGELVASDGSPLRGMEHLAGVTTVEGGEPIRLAPDRPVGGVGVSGAKPHEDGECARAAAESIAKALQTKR